MCAPSPTWHAHACPSDAAALHASSITWASWRAGQTPELAPDRSQPLPEDLFLSPPDEGPDKDSGSQHSPGMDRAQHNALHQAPAERMQAYLRQNLSESMHGTFEPSSSSSGSSQPGSLTPQQRSEAKAQQQQQQQQQRQQHMRALAADFPPASPRPLHAQNAALPYMSHKHLASLHAARLQGQADQAFLDQAPVDPAVAQKAYDELRPSPVARQTGLSPNAQQRLDALTAAPPAGAQHADRNLSRVEDPDLPHSSDTAPSRPSDGHSGYLDSSSGPTGAASAPGRGAE